MKENQSAFCAAEYDGKIRKTLPYYEEFYQQAADAVNQHFQRPVTWLDIGCGTGKMGETAFERCRVEKLTACDPSGEMIGLAKKRLAGPAIEWMAAPVSDLCADSRFDVVTAIQVFHYLQPEERIAALQTCWNALKPDGLLITFENFAPNSEKGKQLLFARWRAFQIASGKTPEEADRHLRRYGTAYFPVSIPAHLEILRQCGFVHAEVLWVSHMQVGLLGIK